MTAATSLPDNWELRRELEKLPDNLTGEVIGGAIYTMGRPRQSHTEVEFNLAADLKRGGRRGTPPPSRWIIYQEVEVLFATGESAVPDLSGWHADRMIGHFEENPIAVVPDWVCEILSSSTRRKDLGVKRAMYAARGVPHLWIVDPDARQLDAFALERGGWRLLASYFEDDVADVAPFEGTPLELSNWWLKTE
ncbi:MAG: Uma2 family endonuclease [Polyangiaceae bacterium]